MRNEERKAAERLIELDGDTVGFLTTLLQDGVTLARAYLAEHLADDGDPVTVDRLQRMGVILDCGEHGGEYLFADLRTNLGVPGTVSGGHVSLCLMFREDGSLAACDLESTIYRDGLADDVKDLEFSIPLPATMAEFRRLCTALGITLTEKPQ